MRAAAMLAALALLGTASCGRADDRATVRETAVRFYAAARSSDAALACAQLSVQTRKQLVEDEGVGCDRAVRSLKLEGGDVESVEVYGVSARLEFASGDVVLLLDTRQGWRVAAAGCRRQAPGPLDCELQA